MERRYSDVEGRHRWSNTVRRTIEQNVQNREQRDVDERSIHCRTGKSITYVVDLKQSLGNSMRSIIDSGVVENLKKQTW